MLDSSRRDARRREIFANLHARLRAHRTDPVARRRLLAEPLASFGLAEPAASPPIPMGERRAPPEAFGEAITGALVFGAAPDAQSPPPLPLEARLTALGLKPAALLHGPEPVLAAWLVWAEERGLWGLLSAMEWSAPPDLGKGGYGNLAPSQTPARPGSGKTRSLLIAPDQDRAVLGWMAVALGWDGLVGEILGFPACCRGFFEAQWPKAMAERQGDLAPLTLAATRDRGNSGPYDWRLNVFARYFGAELLSHFPCSFDCAASLAQARRVEAGLKLIDPALAAKLKSTMRGLAIYSESGGVALAPGGELRDGRISAPQGWRLTDPQGPLARALGAGIEPQLDETGALRLAGVEIPLEWAVFSADSSLAPENAADALAEGAA